RGDAGAHPADRVEDDEQAQAPVPLPGAARLPRLTRNARGPKPAGFGSSEYLSITAGVRPGCSPWRRLCLGCLRGSEPVGLVLDLCRDLRQRIGVLAVVVRAEHQLA